VTYVPKSHRGWGGKVHPAADGARVPREELSEEKLADLHSRHLSGRSVWFTLVALTVLTLAAAVVIIPFVYMGMASCCRASLTVCYGKGPPG
jgi:hypothetical protein